MRTIATGPSGRWKRMAVCAAGLTRPRWHRDVPTGPSRAPPPCGVPRGPFSFSKTEVSMLRIALPNKGRLAEDVRGVFTDAGLEIRASGDRALTASLGGEFEAIFVRSQDIPELVSDGIADAGVTGWDLVCETGRPVDVRLDLEFGRCRLVLAAREDAGVTGPEQFPSGTRAATVFPRLARAFFAEKGLAGEVI